MKQDHTTHGGNKSEGGNKEWRRKGRTRKNKDMGNRRDVKQRYNKASSEEKEKP